MEFLNREKEKKRLHKALEGKKARLVIIYGRRRCGKSTLIRNVLKPGDIYYMAQPADEAIQRRQLADSIGGKIKGFESVIYPDWESLFTNLNNVIKEPLTLGIDEFPYLVKQSPSLPGLLQKITDTVHRRKYNLILCGSSQQMMQGLVLESSSPLYGRADEILKIAPLEAGWITEGLNCSPLQAVAEYSVWGGVPRYWELRREEKTFGDGIKNLILDRYGVLHEEPSRLFLDDMRESVQPFSILSITGGGSNRLSEIAGKLFKPATHLSRPLDNLIQLGYLKREVPFGEPEKNSKKGIYRISDPFMNFYFTFLTPNMSRLEMGMTEQVYKVIESRFASFISFEWENLCRRCVPAGPVNGINFDISHRWWGTNLKNETMALDVVAESTDKKHLLIGECKWTENPDVKTLKKELEEKAARFPLGKGKKIITVLFLKKTQEKNSDPEIFLPADVLSRLK